MVQVAILDRFKIDWDAAAQSVLDVLFKAIPKDLLAFWESFWAFEWLAFIMWVIVAYGNGFLAGRVGFKAQAGIFVIGLCLYALGRYF